VLANLLPANQDAGILNQQRQHSYRLGLQLDDHAAGSQLRAAQIQLELGKPDNIGFVEASSINDEGDIFAGFAGA
jgi:hypothetical protein